MASPRPAARDCSATSARTCAKIEPPEVKHDSGGADPVEGVRRSVLLEYLNWGERSIELDVSDPGRAPSSLETGAVGRHRGRLVSPTRSPSTGWRRRRCWAGTRARRSHSWALQGPTATWPARSLVLQAMSGVMQISGTAHGQPLKPGLNQASLSDQAPALRVVGRVPGRAPYRAAWRSTCRRTRPWRPQLVMNQPYYAFVGAIQGRRSATRSPESPSPPPTVTCLSATTLGSRNCSTTTGSPPPGSRLRPPAASMVETWRNC